MNKRKTLLGIWLMVMTFFSLSAYTAYFIGQMRLAFLLYCYSALVISQIFALVVFLLGTEKIKNKAVLLLYRLCCLASLAVLPAFAFAFKVLGAQYHANISKAIEISADDSALMVPGEETTVYKTDTLYIFFPQYTHVDLECGKRPSKSDESITWCSAAAFQHAVQLGFSDDNIEGYHASKGAYSDSNYVKPGYGAVVFYNNGFRFEFDNPESAIKEAAKSGGSGFMQYALIRDGEIITDLYMPRVRSFRAIAELNGNLCIIDSIKMMNFEDFLKELKEIGVTNALYMDMGAGWNYSWYRQDNGTVKTLFTLKVPWSHNWVVFRT